VSADVNLQPGQPQLRAPLEDGNVVLLSAEPECQGVAGKTAAADEDLQFSHGGLIGWWFGLVVWILKDCLFTMDERMMVQSRLDSIYAGSRKQEPLIPIALINAYRPSS
jgi:hypothetical protein